MRVGDSSTSSWIVFCTNSSKEAICVWTRDYNLVDGRGEWGYVFVKVALNHTPTVFLADDAFFFVTVHVDSILLVPVSHVFARRTQANSAQGGLRSVGDGKRSP